jgi:Ras-related protein Rab-7A
MTSRGRQTLKLLLLGDSGVGKTTLLNKFVSREFTIHYKSTIGQDFSSKQLDVDGKSVTLQIWDTAGQERFHSLGPTFYRGTDCCILVYDVSRQPSFENIAHWQNEFSTQLGLSSADDFPFLLLGNKLDLSDNAVQPSAAQEYAEVNGRMLFYEVSAQTGENVQTAFEAVVRKALEAAPNDEFRITGVGLDQENSNSSTQEGCSC